MTALPDNNYRAVWKSCIIVLLCLTAWPVAGHAQILPPAATLQPPLPPPSPTDMEAQPQQWTINVKDADIHSFVAQVAQITGESFFVDPKLQGKVTVISSTPLTKEGVRELFLTALRVNGFAAVPSGDVVVIEPLQQSKKLGHILTKGMKKNGEEFVTRVIPLHYADVAQMMPILQPMVSDTGTVTSLADANVLIVADRAANVNHLYEIVQNLDVLKNNEMEIVPLKESWVGTIMPLLEKLIPREMKTSANEKAYNQMRIVGDERTNSIMLTGDEIDRKRIKALIFKLDRPSNFNGNTQVLFLQQADAAKVAEMLTALLGKGKTDQTDFSIKADASLNAIIAHAEPSVLQQVQRIVEQLDVRRPQVLIEAAIVEISDELTETLGTQLGAGNAAVSTALGATTFSNAGVNLNTFLSALAAKNPVALGNLTGNGFTAALGQRDKFTALIQALGTTTDANLLSTPSITTLDNEEAKITVGQNVPFLTGQYTTPTSTSNASSTVTPFNTIQRQDVGITLKVTPQIHAGNAVRLKVDQEVSSIASPQTGAVDLVTNKRKISTTILADNGETIVLGGLLQDNKNLGESKVPLLGDIPVLGYLFKSTSKDTTKSNLVVFLRPTILRNSEESTVLTRRKYDGLWELEFGNPSLASPKDMAGTMSRLYDPFCDGKNCDNTLPWLKDSPQNMSQDQPKDQSTSISPVTVEETPNPPIPLQRGILR